MNIFLVFLRGFFKYSIVFYQRFLSPFLGPKCRFYPSCSHYALSNFEKLSIGKALWYSCKRILKCHPFHPGGVDFPPEK